MEYIREMINEAVKDADLQGIAFQHDAKLGKELEEKIRVLQRNKKTTTTDIAVSEIDGVIQRHTGISAFTLADDMPNNASFEIPNLNNKHPLFSDLQVWYFSDQEFEKTLKKAGKLRGMIDLQNGKVYGDFRKVDINIRVGWNLVSMNSPLTPAEVTGIILHEIGHFVSMLELLWRASRTNYLLEEGVRRLLNEETSKGRLGILTAIEKEIGQDLGKERDMAEKKYPADYYRTLIMSAEKQACIHQHGENIYDIRAWEQLADQYASRQGYGVALVSALSKISGWDITGFGFAGRSFMRIMEILNFLGWSYLTFGVYTIIAFSVYTPQRKTYDDLPERIEKIRREYSGALKDRRISAEEKKTILNGIKVIKEVSKDYKEYQTFLTLIHNYLLPWGRKHYKEEKLQLELEKLFNNPLYEAGATLDLAKK